MVDQNVVDEEENALIVLQHEIYRNKRTYLECPCVSRQLDTIFEEDEFEIEENESTLIERKKTRKFRWKYVKSIIARKLFNRNNCK